MKLKKKMGSLPKWPDNVGKVLHRQFRVRCVSQKREVAFLFLK